MFLKWPMVQHRWLKQQHRILRVLLAGQVETSFPTFLNTAAVPFIDLMREDQYFSAFFQILERLFATTLDDNPDLKKRIQSFKTTLRQCPTPIPPPSSYSILTSQLRNKYQDYWILRRFLKDTARFPIATNFIQLVHVLEEEQEKKEQDSSKITVDYLTTHEAIYSAKKAVPLQNLFSPDQKKVHNRILIEGRAGIGKSTFCQYIAHLWGKLNKEEREKQLGPWANQFNLILWLPLRELLDPSESFEQFIADVCFPTNVNMKELKKMLTDPERKVLYFLDGYDEVALLKPRSTGGGILKRFLEQKYWIMTSRPNFYRQWSDPDILHLENIGFSKEDITNFSNRFFKDFDKTEKSKTFATLLSRSAPIRLMAHIPINLELLFTHLLDHTLPEDITLTEIYPEVIKLLASKNRLMQRWAFSSLVNAKSTDRQVCQSLLKLLSDKSIGGLASEILCVIKPTDREICLSLVKSLSDNSLESVAYKILCAIKPTDREICLSLVEFLEKSKESMWKSIPSVLILRVLAENLEFIKKLSIPSIVEGFSNEKDELHKKLWKRLLMLYVRENATLLYEHNGSVFYEDAGVPRSLDPSMGSLHELINDSEDC